MPLFFSFLQLVFTESLSTLLRQRCVRQRRSASSNQPAPTLPLYARLCKRQRPDDATEAKKENVVPREDLLKDLDREMEKAIPDMSHISILNRHLFDKANIPFSVIPIRLRYSSQLVSFAVFKMGSALYCKN
jgi:hypothetical protein